MFELTGMLLRVVHVQAKKADKNINQRSLKGFRAGLRLTLTAIASKRHSLQGNQKINVEVRQSKSRGKVEHTYCRRSNHYDATRLLWKELPNDEWPASVKSRVKTFLLYLNLLVWPHSFKSWLTLSTGWISIQQIAQLVSFNTYPVDSVYPMDAPQLLNNWGQDEAMWYGKDSLQSAPTTKISPLLLLSSLPGCINEGQRYLFNK